MILVPREQTDGPVTRRRDAGIRRAAGKRAIDASVLDIPPSDQALSKPAAQGTVSEMPYDEQLAMLSGQRVYRPEPPPRRRLPWIIDIFLYPMNKPGLTTLLTAIGVPLVLNLIVKLCAICTLVFTPMFVFLVLFQIVRIVLEMLFALYMLWYVFECIKDSAAGQIRAPETLGYTPGLAELWWQLLRIFVCGLFFSAPWVAYSVRTSRCDAVFWILCGGSAFIFPMGLLAVVLFDSFRGLSPVLIIGSIGSTFLQYTGMVVLYYGLQFCAVIVILGSISLLIPAVALLTPRFWILFHLLKVILYYQATVGAHVLGRFYWKYQERLNWDV